MRAASTAWLNSEILLCPGPVMLSTGVKAALTQCEIGHRDARFAEVLARLRRNSRHVFRSGEEHSIVFLGGSATSAIEAVFESLLAPDARVLVPVNGAFGARLVDILKLHGIPHLPLDFGFGNAVDPARIEAAIAAERSNPFTAVAMTHHETSAGLLNPLAVVAGLARQNDLRLIVDATSSAGVEDLDVTRDRIDACITTSGKCLHGPPGLGLVCVRREFLEEARAFPARSFSRDLHRHHDQLELNGQTPFTPSVPLFLALDRAIDELLEAGVDERRRVYWRRRDILAEGMNHLGLPLFPVPAGSEAAAIMTVTVPEALGFESLYTSVKDRGYLIYGCKPPLAPRYFQLAVMGELEDADLDNFLKVMESLVAGPSTRYLGVQG